MDVVCVVVNRLTKLAHFIQICIIYQVSTLVRLYRDQIAKLYGVPHVIISDRDPDSPLHSSSFQRELGMDTRFREYDSDPRGLALVVFNGLQWILRGEFMYNNSCQASIGIAPFEALYSKPVSHADCLHAG